MKKITVTILFILLSLQANSQNTFYIGSKQYPATEKWQFECDSGIDRSPNIFIAKGINEGLFVISTETIFPYYIAGNLLIYLEDGSIITCLDKRIRDEVNNTKTSVYKLTMNEVAKLTNSRINSVRFNLYYKHSNEKLSFIAKNYKHDYTYFPSGSPNKKNKLYYETDIEIKEIFQTQ